MAEEYSVDVCKALESIISGAELQRPMRVDRYDVGDEVRYDVHGVADGKRGTVRAVVEAFVGGGFAGQVYRVKIMEIDAEGDSVGGLVAGRSYAMKILIPPSNFSRMFRNALYWVGFQGPFQLQVNPAAARAGALWQKFIRRGAKIALGSENAVVDIHATFVDKSLGSCGELSEWVSGRTWRLEVDDRLDLLKKWRRGAPIPEDMLGSPEYRAKYRFMKDFVRLLHDMGGHEFARQYEWSTCKSQPNCLKREGHEDDPGGGLVAVDFRAGLALLPFLPMSPGDFPLIIKGIGRGSLVQFDRGSLQQLDRFVAAHPDTFADMADMLAELKQNEDVYRNSVPDVTHNHVRLFFSRHLWSTMLSSARVGWQVQGLVDQEQAHRFDRSWIKTLLFMILGLIPIVGAFVRKVWGRKDWRGHYVRMLSNLHYFRRAVQARIAEKLIGWHRVGRVDGNRALELAGSGWRFFCHVPFSLLPVGIHRLATDFTYAKERIDYLLLRPVRLYFNRKLREEWLLEMVTEGQKKHILSDEDAGTILSQLKEPFIQKYLKSLAVHVCTLPVTQLVAVIVALVYIYLHPGMTWQEASAVSATIIIMFQVVPISPGSLVRGLYVLYLVIRERNFKDYNIAVFLGFFKYVGYLAFPIQMAYRYPVLARFMAAHWANQSVHIVPVFGESGALLEHWVYGLFYNWPLTIRRRILRRMEIRKERRVRYWHIVATSLLAAGIFGAVDFFYLEKGRNLPSLKEVWWMAAAVPLLCGAAVTLGFGGAGIGKRIAGAGIGGALVALFYTLGSVAAGVRVGSLQDIVVECVWRVFLFSIFGTIGAVMTELFLGDGEGKKVKR